jgi:hypothetical protein
MLKPANLILQTPIQIIETPNLPIIDFLLIYQLIDKLIRNDFLDIGTPQSSRLIALPLSNQQPNSHHSIYFSSTPKNETDMSVLFDLGLSNVKSQNTSNSTSNNFDKQLIEEMKRKKRLDFTNTKLNSKISFKFADKTIGHDIPLIKPQQNLHNYTLSTECKKAQKFSLNDKHFISVNTLDHQEAVKIEKRRARNREAARKCRSRKCEQIALLDQQVKKLNAKNFKITNESNKLKAEINNLKQLLQQHKKVHECDTYFKY